MLERKQQLRRRALDARNDQRDKLQVSEAAIARVVGATEYRVARTAMWYLDCRSELRTTQALPDELRGDKCIVVPYCTTDGRNENKLGLWKLEDLRELVVGMFYRRRDKDESNAAC